MSNKVEKYLSGKDESTYTFLDSLFINFTIDKYII